MEFFQDGQLLIQSLLGPVPDFGVLDIDRVLQLVLPG